MPTFRHLSIVYEVNIVTASLPMLPGLVRSRLFEWIAHYFPTLAMHLCSSFTYTTLAIIFCWIYTTMRPIITQRAINLNLSSIPHDQLVRQILSKLVEWKFFDGMSVGEVGMGLTHTHNWSKTTNSTCFCTPYLY